MNLVGRKQYLNPVHGKPSRNVGQEVGAWDRARVAESEAVYMVSANYVQRKKPKINRGTMWGLRG